ncbi:MAG: DUF817 domain-containing protein, partial [Beijerinckiaceae bacterium]
MESVQNQSNSRSAAARWGFLRPYVAWEYRFGRRMAATPVTAFAYEFFRFGVKQAWACLFGGIMVAMLLASHLFYPRNAALPRYDFLVIASLAVQAAMLAFKLETWEEAKVIFLFHAVGTVMEIFKTAVGSWIYPEPSYLRIGGVPLFTGFMYAAVGSYIARVWRLSDFRFVHHPPLWQVFLLAFGVYVNFFTHHYIFDARWLLLALAGAIFWRTWIYYKVWKVHRRMPLLIACFLCTAFIWLAENIGTYSRAWIYPNQANGWSMVSLSKMSSWFLLLIVSYALVALVTRPRNISEAERAAITRRN